MAEAQVSDLIMKFEVTEGNYINGESTTQLDMDESDMATGFTCASFNKTTGALLTPGNLMEVQTFSFRTSVDGSDDEEREKNKAYSAAKKQGDSLFAGLMQAWRSAGSKPADMPKHPGPGMDKPSGSGSFAKWHQGQAQVYKPEISPVEVTRGIDVASPELLQYCIDRKTFYSATLIKRKAAGQFTKERGFSGEIYLRFDFSGVLITKVDWDEDEPTKEKLSFIARGITISYHPQLPDGSLGAVKAGFWTMSPDVQAFNLRG